LRLIGSPVDRLQIYFDPVLSLKHKLSSYWFVATNNRIMATSANETRLLAIMCAPVRMVMNKVRKRNVLANGAGVEEAVEVNPFMAIH
jgi:hypothetical protein